MVQSVPRIYTRVAAILRIALCAALCILAILEFVKQSLQLYRATNVWQPNRYMKLLLKQGVLYFLVYVPSPPGTQIHKQTKYRPELTVIFRCRILLCSVISILTTTGNLPAMFILEIMPVYTLAPRFITSIRRLYVRDGQGRADTAFGLSSFPSSGIVGTTRSMVFADVEPNDENEGVE